MTSNDRPAQGTIHIGDEAKPAFAVRPDPERLFETRARRLAALAATPHPGATYLAFLARVLFWIEAPWLNLPIIAGTVYLWVKFYRRIKEIRRETERQGVRSDEIDTMAENAVMPLKLVLILFAVFGGVALFLVLMIWGAKHIQ